MKITLNDEKVVLYRNTIHDPRNGNTGTSPYITVRKNSGAVVVLVRRRIKDSRTAA